MQRIGAELLDGADVEGAIVHAKSIAREGSNLDRAELRSVDLNQLWRDTVSLVDEELAPRVRFELHLEPVPLIQVRPQQLVAVFPNLVRNGAAAITATGEDGTIRVSTSSSDKEISDGSRRRR